MSANAFATASHTFADGMRVDYYAPAFDLHAYDENDVIMRATYNEINDCSVPWMPFIAEFGTAGYARAFARSGDNGHTAIICLAVSAYHPNGKKFNKVTERLSIDLDTDTAEADVLEGIAKVLAGFLNNIDGITTGIDPLDLYDLARTLRG